MQYHLMVCAPAHSSAVKQHNLLLSSLCHSSSMKTGSETVAMQTPKILPIGAKFVSGVLIYCQNAASITVLHYIIKCK